jgi:TonB family protein
MPQQKTVAQKIIQSLLFVPIVFASVFSANAQSQANIPVPVSTDSIRKARPNLDKPDKNGVYQVVEKMPSYPEGEKALLAYIGSNLHYPVIAQENGIQGTVIVRFIVTNDGNVDKIEVLRSLDPACDKEAVRVLRSMSSWTPGEQNGKKVSVYYTLPIKYKLTGAKSQSLDPTKKPLMIIDGKIAPSDFNFSTLNKDSIKSVDVIMPDKKEKLDEISLKFGTKTSNGVIIIVTKQYARLKASGEVQLAVENPKVIEDKEINFDNFKDGETPLFIIDGKVSTRKDISSLNKKEIQEITVLKDKASAAVYGDKGKNGVVIITLKKGKSEEVLDSVSNKLSKDNRTFEVVEQMPEYPGGVRALLNFIGTNLRYPVEAQKAKIQGRVIVRFVVNKAGQVEKGEIIRSLSPECDRESLRVIRMMPDWKPGMQKGKTVSVWYTLPIQFKLE